MIFVLTHLPGQALQGVRGNDKVAHFSVFLLLALLYWLVRYGRKKPSLRNVGLYWMIGLIAVYAALDELTQEFVRGRSGEILDWCADMGGMAAGVVLLYVLRGWRHWLVAYWLAMFAVTHWPGKDGAFVRLPGSWQQFQVCFVMMGYVGLTFLFWRGMAREGKFVVNKRILGLTLFVLGFYAVVDEWLSWAMGRGFDGWDLLSAAAGIALGIVCSIALARHNILFDEDYPAYSKV